jgi:hypothetical protein
VNYPCGLIARSVFNDTYDIRVKGPSDGSYQPLKVDSTAKSIAWAADTAGKFRNLDPEATDQGTPYQVHLNMWINERFPPVECVQKEVTEEKPYVPVYVAMREESAPPGSSSNTTSVVDCTGYFATNSGGRSVNCEFVRLGEPFECSGDYEKRHVEDWGLESGHFIVWMRIAGLPTFRKLWGKINEPLKAGSRLRVHFSDHFPVKEFYGRKAFVLTTSSALGGRNDFLGYGYIAFGCCCLIFGAAFLWQNTVKPRPLGDISLLANI